MSIQGTNAIARDVELPSRNVATQSTIRSQVPPVIAPQPVDKQQVTPDALQRAIDEANKVFAHVRPDIKFVIEEESNDVVIMLVEPETGDVINRYPTVQAIAISSAITKAQEAILEKQALFKSARDELAGLLIAQRT